MTDLEFQKLRDILAKATQGEWVLTLHEAGMSYQKDGPTIADFYGGPGDDVATIWAKEERGAYQIGGTIDDACAIFACVAAVPKLIARIEELESSKLDEARHLTFDLESRLEEVTTQRDEAIRFLRALGSAADSILSTTKGGE
jgi:hypothetical protein